MPTCTMASTTQVIQKRPFTPGGLVKATCLTVSLFFLTQLFSVGLAQCISNSTLTIPVTLSGDDATEVTSGTVSTINTSSADLAFFNRYIGIRFASVYIPKSATITNAYIQFTGNSATSTSAGISNVGIRGHNVANSNSFTAAIGSNDISSRYTTAPTSASVNWTNSATWTNGAQGVNQRTPDLKAIVQEIVNRSDWKPNNAITLLLNATSGTGPSANAYDEPSSGDPKLVITYQATTTVTVTPTVSGCYNTTAGSRATVSVEVGWTDAPANDNLVIKLGNQTRQVTPGINVISFFDPDPYETQVPVEFASPQVFTFEIPADGSGGTVTASFASNTVCTSTASFTAPAACQPITCTSGTDLSGTAFNDFNGDGVKNAGETTGVSGIVVKAYDCAGTVYTTTTDVNGQYKLTIPLANYPVRLEFTNLPSAYSAQGTPNGVDGRTTVQFITAPDCGVDLGMSDPTDYCQNNPKIFVPCYVNGNPLASGTAGTQDAFVSVNYNDFSTSTGSGNYTNSTNPAHIASASQVGALWGTVYNKQTKTIFTSSVLRRHAGLGPLGLGGIYAINPTTNAVSNFLDVTNLGINVGSASVGSNVSRGLSASAISFSHDSAAFAQVGKVGIGGLTISSDGNQLYFVNLFDKKVYRLDISAYNAGGASPTTSTSFAIPNGCSNGNNSRPWGIKYHKGKVYVGVICDGSVTDNRSDMRAFVYALDPVANTWSTIFDFPLTYPKGPALLNDDIQAGAASNNWRTWTDNFDQLVFVDGHYLLRSQPILSGIEFDIDNSMVLGFADRTGLQGAADNYGTRAADTKLYYAISGGDILRAANINGVYILENNAKVAGITGALPNNSQGPGSGEFYNDDFVQVGILVHTENALGGLAIRPGSGNVLTSAMDPLNEVPYANGFRQFSNANGSIQSSYVVFQNGNFQKSVGLGDFELGCTTPTFIEIGNRVWFDTDNDGIQDPCEQSLSGVNVSLYKAGAVVATTTTNANGEYYFSSKSKLTNGTWNGTGADTTLLPNTAYQVVFGTGGQFTGGSLTISSNRYQLTQALSTAPTASTLNDSNVQLATIGGNSLPAISFTTGGAGTVNHTLDAGFTCAPAVIASLVATPAVCVGQTVTANSARIDLTGVQNGDKAFLYTAGPAPSYTAVSGQPVSSSAVSFTGLADPATSAGQSYSIIVYSGPVCSTVVSVTLAKAVCGTCAIGVAATPGACQAATNSYTVTGTVSLTSATAGLVTVTDGSSTTSFSVSVGQISATYSLTGLLSNASLHTVTATLPGCSTATTTYTAPASCSVAPSCGLAMVVTPGLCTSATNTYALSGTITSTNVPASGTLTINSDAFTPRSLTLPAGNASGTFSYSGLVSNGQTYTITASYSNSACAPVSQTFTAPVSCSVAPPCSLSAVATAGQCSTATNTYSASVVVSLTNSSAGTLTVSLPGTSPISQTIAANTPTFTAVFNGLVSDGLSHTATISLPDCGTTTATFTAPASCSIAPVCSLSAVASAGTCSSATNTYSASVTVTVLNPVAATLTVNLAGGSQTFSTTANAQNTFTAVFNGLVSDGLSHTATVSLPGCGTTTATYTAPASCSVAPVCSISAVATAGQCATATNTYSSTVVVTVNNPTSGTLLITDGTQTQPFATTAGATNTFTVIFPGLVSNGSTHSVVATLPGCSTATTTYTAPASCSVAPGCNLSVTASGSNCNPATNQYVLSGTINLTNSPTSQTLTLTDGSYVRSLTANAGTTSIAFSYTTLQSDGAVHTVTVTSSASACATTSTTYTAPASCSVAPVCSISAVATPGLCSTATNTFSNTVTVTMNNPTTGILTVTDGVNSVTFTVPASTGTTTAVATFNGIVSNGASHTVTATLPGCSTTTTTYTAPGSCTQPTGTQLTLSKYVSKPKAKLGDVLTYTVVLTNTGSTTATNVAVRDSMTTGLRYVGGSATAPTGTTFNQGTPLSTWTVGSLTPSQSFTLTYQAIADSSGILYNKATIPGDTAKVCTTIPVQVCTGDVYLFRLNAPAGRTSYKWYKNGVLIVGQTTHILDITTPGSYSLAADSLSGLCPSFSCCPFIVEEDTLPTFQASALAATCAGGLVQANGQLVLSNFKTGYTYQYSTGTDFNESAPLSGTAQTIPVNGIIANNLPNPVSAQAYTVRVFNSSGCYTDVTVTLNPTACICSLSAVATPSQCNTATNTYSALVAVSLTNSLTGTITVSIPGASPVSQTVAANTSVVTITVPGLPSDGAIHTATVSLPGCSTATAVYSAPASCSVAPPCSLSAVATAGQCSTATNTYSASVVVSLTNSSAGTLTLSLPGTSPISQTISANTSSFTAVFNGLVSDGLSHTATISLPGCGTTAASYTAPTSCSVAIPVLALTVTPGTCQSATNQYSISGTLSLTNAPASTVIFSDGLVATTVSVSAGATSVAYTLAGLSSGTGSHTVTASLVGQVVSATYTAPTSCSVAPVCSMTAIATPSQCMPGTNTYSALVAVSLSNPVNGTITVSIPGASPVSQTVAANTSVATVVVPGLLSDGGIHTATVTLPGCSTTTSVYSAPVSCSVAPPCSLSAVATAGQCSTATNTYSASVVVSLTNSSAGTLTLSLPGTSPISQTIAANTPTFTAVFNGLVSDGLSHTATISLPDCGTTTATFTAPASCSIAPVCSLSAVASAGTCSSATNTYSASVTVTVLNPVAATLTVNLAGGSQTFSTTANAQNTFTAVFNGLVSDGLSHTATVSLPGCGTTTATYTAPASCSVAPPCSITAVATAGQCATATNTYSALVVVSLTNPVNGTITVSIPGASPVSQTVAANASVATISVPGLPSDGAIHTATVTLPGCSTTTAVYSAPASCSVAPPCSLSAVATAGTCSTATNTYSASVTVTVLNPSNGTLSVNLGGNTQTVSTTANGQNTFTVIFTNLPSDGLTHTATASLPGCGTSTSSYTAPSCSVAPVCSITAVATAGQCTTATNTYSALVVVSLTNPVNGTITVSIPGASPVSQTVAANASVATISVPGLPSDGAIHTATVTLPGCSTTTAVYSAPASCSVASTCSMSAVVTAGVCQSATNTFTTKAVITLANPVTGILTVTDGPTSMTFATVTGASASFTATFANLVSDGSSHTVVASLPGCSTTVSTYTAPASCSVGMTISVTDPGVCQPNTNTYNTTGVIALTNAPAGIMTISDGILSLTVTVAAGTTSVPYSMMGLLSGSGLHTVTVSFAGQTAQTTYMAPVPCCVSPVCVPIRIKRVR
ncbi:SdrD B-like domain-containing protein [Spirosoma aerolatum]|uniref:SdrD B-like domain-containing protein n=1 Tax=Spirosoma aerolatum TaxID=1211326 RepID=UPI0009AE5289|nr:SdrD B-like domain-containing protein [Spirosoma aerolatum]